MTKHNGDSELYTCLSCPKKFETRESLSEHENKIHLNECKDAIKIEKEVETEDFIDEHDCDIHKDYARYTMLYE